MEQLTDFARPPVSVRTADFQLSTNEDTPLFSLTGRDKQGRPWRLNLRDAARGAWRSEQKGQRTYYFAGYTGATGSGPMTWILALSFDERGRPVPFYLYTHGGIEDVLDLDGTGPELLEQDYQGNIRDDPGYFVTTLYEQRGCYWYRSDGRHGEHVFPTSEKWSIMWSNKPAILVQPSVFKRPVLDSTNDPAKGTKAAILRAGQYNTLYVRTDAGCSMVAPSVLVWDNKDGRNIELEDFGGSLEALAEARERVILTGVYHLRASEDCRASIVWASTAR